MSFSALGLSPEILEALVAQGYDSPSPIQAKAIPAVIEGRDVMAAAQTGTGKTAGFTLPILERLSKGKRAGANRVRALVLTPTRELAAQVGESVETYGKHLPLSSCVVYGGVKINPQMMNLRKGADILVATPGRLLDLHSQNAVKFDHIEVLVLDEADKMLNMGFIRDIKKILALLPKRRQNLLFSATFTDEIRDLAKGLVHNPVEISVSPRNTTAQTVEQYLYATDKNKKSKLLLKLIQSGKWQQVLVFTRTKHGANRLARFLDERGIKTLAIHGNKSQGARTKALAQFKDGEISVLVATDIAARGLDISQLPYVVNFDLPHVSEDYVHRIGRTGRAGSSGMAISLVCADEFKLLVAIERLIQKAIERKVEPGFEAVNELEPSPAIKPLKAKKPKKPKKPKPAKTEHIDGQRSGDMAKGHNKSSQKPADKTGQKPGKKPNQKPSQKPAHKPSQKSSQDSNKNNNQNSAQNNRQKPRNSQKPTNNQRRRRPRPAQDNKG